MFAEIKDTVASVVLNTTKSCIFAYGQTGAGKTYTMFGEAHSDFEGIIPRSARLIFELIDNQIQEGLFTEKTNVTLSCIELHCETIQDLLNLQHKTTQLI